MDQRTVPLGEIDYGTPRNDREFAALTWRNFATTWTRGFNAYLFDIGGGFYDTEARHDIIGRQIEMIKDSLHWPHENMPGIAMIIDDTAVLETNGSGNFLNEAVMWEQKMGIARCGVRQEIRMESDTRRRGLRRRVHNCCAAACRPVARHFTVGRCPCVLR